MAGQISGNNGQMLAHRVHTRQWGKIKTTQPRHRLNYAPGLHNTKLSSFMLSFYWLGAELPCSPKSSKGSQEYLNRAFFKIRLPEYELYDFKVHVKIIYAMNKFHGWSPAYKRLCIIFQKLTALWQKLLSSQTLRSVS